MEQKIYTFDEALQASIPYFGGDELAAKVWVNKYALKDSYGNIYEKTPTICIAAWQMKGSVLRLNILML